MKNYKITINGNVYNVTVEEGANSGYVEAPAYQAPPAQIAPPVAAPAPIPAAPAPQAAPAPAPQAAPAPVSGGTEIEAPMPGTILRYTANVGDTVQMHQVVAILEAMKMENEIVTPVGGVVASINVQPGNSADAGQVIMVIK